MMNAMERLKVKKFTGKFSVTISGRLRTVYFIGDPLWNVIKIDGEHTYLWYRDASINPESVVGYNLQPLEV